MAILKVENLNLVFRLEMHRSWTWRDAFVRAIHDPVGSLLPNVNQLHILKNVSFTVQSGERIGILGVNGTGKTSLCRCIAGIYKPNSGIIQSSGPVRAVFDTGIGIYPELSGRENAVVLARLLYPNETGKYQSIVDEAIEFSELGTFADVPYRLYSNGMQARLCLSLISSRPSELLILDEVFDGADIFFRKKVSQRILKMIESSGAVLFISHSSDQIDRACNRVIVLSQGEIAYDGAVAGGISFYEGLNPALSEV